MRWNYKNLIMDKKTLDNSDGDSSNERRQFYRVADSIGLEYKLLDQAPTLDATNEEPFAVSSRFKLLNELNRIDQESSVLLRHISDDDRNLARYLTSQNKKIDTIAKLIVSDEMANVPYDVRNISLSEGGCSFINEEKLDMDQHIALKLFFFSSYLGMVLYGQVVDSQPIDICESNQLFKTYIEFSDMSGPDRQMLARYIIRRQAEQRRAEDDA